MSAPDRKTWLEGRTSSCATLFNVAARFGQEAAVAFAAGLVEGARDWLVAHVGEQAAYEAIQAAADRTAEPLVRTPAEEAPRAAE